MTCAASVSTDWSSEHRARTPTSSPPRGSESRSSTPSSKVDYFGHFSRRTNLPHPSSSAGYSGPSTMSLATTSPTRVSGWQPETCHKIQRPGDQEDLAPARHVRRPVRVDAVEVVSEGSAVESKAAQSDSQFLP